MFALYHTMLGMDWFGQFVLTILQQAILINALASLRKRIQTTNEGGALSRQKMHLSLT